MIFVTVGTQLPFDRMVRTIDDWAGKRGRRDVFAQIGPSHWSPRNVQWVKFLEPVNFREKFEAAKVIVAHAGMGSIITALDLGKPVIVMPRRGDLKEHRNDHQIATAKQFLNRPPVSVAFDEDELSQKLDHLDDLMQGERVAASASPQLLMTLRNFIDG